MSEQPTTLYRLYDAAGDLLYVGISLHPPYRFKTHETERPWWYEVTTIRLEVFHDPMEAAQAEREAIRLEHPRHNVKGVPAERRPPKPPKPVADAEGLADQLAGLLAQCADEDPIVRNRAAIEVIETARRVRSQALAELHRALGSWQKVGDAVGLPRQDAWRVGTSR